MDEGSEDYKLARAKLDLNHALARAGLRGTLFGAWATLIAIVLIVAIQTLTERYVLDGWPLASLAAVVVVSVIFMGGYIFSHAVKFGAQFGEGSKGVFIGAKPASKSES